jgi:SAM-dependent methyltransferase
MKRHNVQMGRQSMSVLSNPLPAKWIEEVDRCPLCGSTKLDLLFLARDTLHNTPGEWGVVRCAECSLMHTSPRPTRSSITRFYPDEYQPYAAHFAPDRLRGSRLRAIVRRLLDPKEVVIPSRESPRKMLEVGCGSGRTLVELADDGWDVHGLEPSTVAAGALRAHRDLSLTIGAIEETHFAEESFDLILATMVLEHLHDPLADLRRLRSWLRPGGHLTGSVPNCASWEFRRFGRNWYALQVPTHLFHFTPRTLTNVLVGAGFSNVRIHHQRNISNLMIHLGRFLERSRMPFAKTCLEYPERGSRLLRLATRPAASVLAWTRQAGRITFEAAKP